MLATQDDLERYLQIDFGVDPEPVATLLLGFASRVVETFCGRSLEEGTYTETLDGEGAPVLFLSQWPVTSITSITEEGSAVVVDVDFLWYPDGRLYRGDSSNRLRWTSNLRSVVVEYVAGYAVIPSELVLVATRIAGRIFQASAAFANAPASATGVKQISLTGSDSISFSEAVADVSKGLNDLDPIDRMILSNYRRRDL